MKKKTIHPVKFRRRRKGITNYKTRLKLLMSGKSRLVVRKSLKNINAQIVKYSSKGDVVAVAAHSSELKKYGWKGSQGNLPAAYLTGLLLGQKAKKKDIKEVILDLGLNAPVKGGKLYAALKGVIDAGIKVPHSDKILPSEDRINGKHISKYAESLKSEKEKYEKQFSLYLKNDVDPAKINEYFAETKKKINEV